MNKLIPITDQKISGKIYLLRGKRVMMDFDLAELYGVETGHLKRQVRRNLSRFPEDFMFQLTREELKILRRQIGISSWGGSRYLRKLNKHEKEIQIIFAALKRLINPPVLPGKRIGFRITKDKD